MTSQKGSVIGSAMVVGGGVAGVQAAIDLANSGYLVYLVEKSPAIGGVMSQLDKTFPTNDCSMCILSPKLVECGRHPNIHIITLAEVLGVEGKAGHFQVSLRKTPRYIDPAVCTACGDCAQVCPVERSSEYDMGLSSRKTIFKAYAQAIPGSFAIEKLDKAPCRMACPAHLNVQGYVQMVKAGKYREAIEIILKDLPFPGILGRVCPHRCEKSCRRLEKDEAISIRELKRVAADRVPLSEIPVPPIAPKGKRAAIIGGGPAGLSAAYFLALAGYKTTVYEAMPQAGGMMRYGIPAHRLPRAVLDAEIENLKRYGIEIHTGKALGRDFTLEELQAHGADAVFLAMGAWKPIKLRVPGEESEGVQDVTAFLREVHLGNLRCMKGKVAVVGGGHSALDAARVALRLGASEARILYRRSKAEMPAEPEEVEEAEREGILIHILTAPIRIGSDGGKANGIECIRTRLTEPDTTGRRKPVPVEGSEFFIEAENIIVAIGQEPDLSWINKNSGLELSRWNFVVVNPETLQTSMPGIFAGGDIISGPATVIEAVEAGKRAARYMAMYLDGETLPTEWQEDGPVGQNWTPIPQEEGHKPRKGIKTLPVGERVKGFEEVNLSMDDATASAEAERCLNCGGCCECYQCVTVCKASAVTLDTHAQQVQEMTLDVGSVILAPGFKAFDPTLYETYGYASFTNVVTSMEFERILSATGPYQGHLKRPSDGAEPRSIAWFQCVGSRDVNRCDHGYCSSVCCMYAIKEAVIAKEHAEHGLDTAIFYMDMRTSGKDFERYYMRAQDEHGVRFIRSRIHSVEQAPGSKDLVVRYLSEDGLLKEEVFDMIVLSVGMETSPDVLDLANRLDIAINEAGFAATSPFAPVSTSRPGIFVCGAFQGPKDIPQSVMEASAAAAQASTLLAPVRGTLTSPPVTLAERDISEEEPRVGVFVCHCGINIGSVVDVPAVKEYARGLPNVAYVEENLFTCSQDTQDKMKEVIRKEKLNRIVVASCSPRTHEPLFQQTIHEAGLNKYLFELANIRDQDSWVHQKEPEAATLKAKDLVRMAVAKVALQQPLHQTNLGITRSAIVIGGGLAGMEAALGIADQGYPVTLVERGDGLGGNALRLSSAWTGDSIQPYLDRLVEKVKTHEKISVRINTVLKDVRGFVGNFVSTLEADGGSEDIAHGVAVIATGGLSYIPDEYGYGKSDRILLSLDLDRAIDEEDDRVVKAQSAVFIQCVGSREPERPYCSRVCCSHSVESALRLKELNPKMDVAILYRDIRTYGMREHLYKAAREKGVLFIRYDREHKPQVELEGEAIHIMVRDSILKENLLLRPDILTLASAIVPRETGGLAKMFKVPLNAEGFFLEAHMKLRPVDFATEGVFVAGLVHWPKPTEECIAQAKAAAARAVSTVLSRESILAGGVSASIHKDRCIGCRSCEECCPFGAISYLEQEERCEVNQALCKGCGTCAATCPSEAISLMGFSHEQLYRQIDEAMAF